jgi:hypothetical protein
VHALGDEDEMAKAELPSAWKGRRGRSGRWAQPGPKGRLPCFPSPPGESTVPQSSKSPRLSPPAHISPRPSLPGSPRWGDFARKGYAQRRPPKAAVALAGPARPCGSPSPPASREAFRNARGCGSLEPGVGVGADCRPGGSPNSEGISPSSTPTPALRRRQGTRVERTEGSRCFPSPE